jgi:raffinose/stachyose/melibiose transport system substrate-binding protein
VPWYSFETEAELERVDMKTRKTLGISAIVLVLLLAGCSSGKNSATSPPSPTAVAFPTGPITLNISWWGDQEAPGAKKWLRDTMALYTKAHPNITLTEVLQTTDGLVPAFAAAAAAKSGPDIQYFWGGIYAQQPGWDGSIVPISDYISTAELSHYTNAKMEEGYQGKVWTAPWYVNPSFPLLVRKDILAANNLKIPTTWAQLMNVCDVLSAKKITTIAGGVKDGWFGGWLYSILGSQSIQSQADVISAVVGTTKFTDPAMADWWSRLAESKRRNCWNDDINSLQLYQAQQRFVDGKAAMTVTAGSDAPNFVKKAGGDTKAEIMAMPAWSTGPYAGKMGTSSQTLGITSWSKYPQVAADFIQFGHTTERLNAWYQDTGALPADDRFDLAQVKSPSTKALFQSALNGAPYLENFIPAQLDTDAIFKNVQLILKGTITPVQAAQDTQALMERIRKTDRKVVANFTAWAK